MNNCLTLNFKCSTRNISERRVLSPLCDIHLAVVTSDCMSTLHKFMIQVFETQILLVYQSKAVIKILFM